MTFRNSDFYINDKERFERPSAVKEDKKMGKSRGKRRKMFRLIYIVLTFFFIAIQKITKIDKNFCTDLIFFSV